MRKTELSHDDLKKKAVLEAERLAQSGGLSAISMRPVAKAAQCSPGTLYNVIGDLDELVLLVNARTTEAITDCLEQAADKSDDPVRRIYEMADAYVALGMSDARLWSVLFDYVYPEERKLPDWYSEILSQPVLVIQKAVGSAFATEEQCTRFVSEIWVSLHGVLILAMKNKLVYLSEKSVQHFVKDLISTHLTAHGVEARNE
ncbi:MAG: TetR/AcrR family transcriptional regulator [Hyphomicrobiales bacterium]